MTTSNTSSTLVRAIISYAGQLTSLAKSYAPTHLKNKISTHVNESDGNFRITIEAKAPDARAQEYGSGRQDKKNPHDIKIFPVNGKMLAFLGTHGYGNEFAQYDPSTRQGVGDKIIVLTPQVLHNPGIHAVNEEQGYIRPAVKEFRKRIKAKDGLSGDLKRAILKDIRKSFKVE